MAKSWAVTINIRLFNSNTAVYPRSIRELRSQTTRKRARPGRKWKMHSQIGAAPTRCIAARAIFAEIERRRTEETAKECAAAHRDGGDGRELNRVHMSSKRACHRVEERRYIWRASICRSPLIWQHLHTAYSLWAIYSLANSPLLAFGHQCVWLTLLVAPLTPDYISICIHSRTSLSPTARLCSLVPLSLPRPARVPAFFVSRSCADDWPTIFVLPSSLSRLYACHIFPCGNAHRVQVRRRYTPVIWQGLPNFAWWWWWWWCNLLCVF